MAGKSVEILLVEDNRDDLEHSLRFLDQLSFAHRVHVVRHGAEALEFIFRTGSYAKRDISHTPDLVLLDLTLPLVNGVEVLRRLRADPRTRAIPVVVLASSREERDAVAGYRFEACGTITKPVHFEEFTEAVRALWLALALAQPASSLKYSYLPSA